MRKYTPQVNSEYEDNQHKPETVVCVGLGCKRYLARKRASIRIWLVG